MTKSHRKQSWHETLLYSIRKISEEQSARVLPRRITWSMHVKGEIKDPLIEKLLDTVNNENEQELEQILKAENSSVARLTNADIKGGTLLHYASSRNNVGVVELLLRYGFDKNRRTTSDIDLYIEAFDYVSKFRSGTTPMYIATVAGLTNIVTVLAKHGADPNIQDVEGYTPIHSAAWHNKTDLIRQLLTCGAKVNIQDITGSTPLRKASYRGHTDSVKHLLGNGADPNIKTKKGRASIHCAALYGHTEVLALLLDHGAQVNIQDNDDVTPLHAAVYNGKRLAVRLLLKSQADVDVKTKFGNTALHLACMERWFVIASLLVQAGANFEIENRFGETPGSIMNTGNVNKKVNIFNKQNAPNMSELEKMEAEQKERNTSFRQIEANGQHSITTVLEESSPSQGFDKKDKRLRQSQNDNRI